MADSGRPINCIKSEYIISNFCIKSKDALRKFTPFLPKSVLGRAICPPRYFYIGGTPVDLPVNIPVWEKYMLTVREAAAYFGIGEHKLREMLDSDMARKYSAWNGKRQLIKRKQFEEFLDNCDRID